MASPKHLWSGDWERESEARVPAEPPRPAPDKADAADAATATAQAVGEPAPEAQQEPEATRLRAGGMRVGAGNGPEQPGRRTLVVASIAIFLALVVGVVLAATLGGSSKHRAPQSAQAQAPSAHAQPQQPNRQGNGVYTLTLPQVSPAPQQSAPQLGSPRAQTTPQAPATPQQAPPNQSAPQQSSPQQAPPQAQAQPQQPSTVTSGPTYKWLGMQIANGAAGITVATVSIGSSADKAGVNPGDVIESVGQHNVNSVGQLRSAIQKLKLGQNFQLTVDRGSTPVTLLVTLTNRPARQS